MKLQGLIVGFMGIIATLIVGVLGIVCGVFSETFSIASGENLSRWWSVFLEHGKSDFHHRVDLGELSSSSLDEATAFIFILDCSDSPTLSMQPFWLDETLVELDKSGYPVQRTLGAGADEQSNAQRAMKGALFWLLATADHLYGSTPEPQHEFAIWSVCARGERLFPEEGRLLPLSNANVERAIARVDETIRRHPTDQQTELLDLFERIIATYGMDGHADQDTNGGGHRFLITMISDFDDQPAVKTADRDVRLRRAMKTIVEENTQINMVMVGNASTPPEVVSYFETYSDWHRVGQFDISGDLPAAAKPLLIPLHQLDHPIKLYYSNPSYGRTRATLQTAVAGPMEFTMPVLDEVSNRTLQVAYAFQLNQRSDEEVEYTPPLRIRMGLPTRLRDVRKNEIIELSFTGAIPRSHQLLRITAIGERRAYLVPVLFVPRLPKDVCDLVAGVIAFSIIVLAGLAFIVFISSRHPPQSRSPK